MYNLGVVPTTGQKYIQCTDCGQKSFNQGDIDNKYCHNCDMFHPAEIPPPTDPDQSAAITKLQRETLVAGSKKLADGFIIMQSELEKQFKTIAHQAGEITIMKDHIYQLEQRAEDMDSRIIELEVLSNN